MPAAFRINAVELSAIGASVPTCAAFLAAVCQVDEQLVVQVDNIDTAGFATVMLTNGYGVRLVAGGMETWIEGFDPNKVELWLIYSAEDGGSASVEVTDERDLPVGLEPEVVPRAELTRVLAVRIRELQACAV